MKLSHASSYALHALVHLARTKPDQCVPSYVIAQADGTPERLLLKIPKSLGIPRRRQGLQADGSAVPARLFWSVTAYDACTRSQVQADQDNAALGSLYNKFTPNADRSVTLYFGPKAPPGKEGQWIQTVPGKGWFTYFRIYGPKGAAFDGTWRPHDFERAD
jgi:hypothetical protein